MSDPRWQRMWALFHEAAELAGDERARWLERECADDPQLRSEIEALLVEHEQPSVSLDGDAWGGAAEHAPGDAIGPYRIVRLIGEGGMGIVYEAEQLEPVRRTVALKLVRPGMDTREVVSRFRLERQTLASLEHPNIARVYDAGATEQGRPYFAMELVEGIAITEFCDRGNLGIEARIELFARVCEGVQHAHQRGIIHRDLKPSNVLVTVADGHAVPKIIDFGIARATQRHIAEATAFTEHGRLVGTPEYMSPEQAGMTGEDVDVRTDVYALGVLLYELLSGAQPFDPRRLRQAGYEEMRRIIREENPPLPSARVSRLGRQATDSAGHRGLQPDVLVRRLRGDLDWIVLKSIEKDRARRYDSPAQLSLDLRRFRENHPIEARPPSSAYRARKFVRRHFVVVAAAVAVVLALIAGVSVGAVGLVRARAAQRQAQHEATVARAVSEFLTALFEGSRPGSADAGSVTAREILDRGEERVHEALVDQPEIRAPILQTIARVYRQLGIYERAEPLFDEAVAVFMELYGPRDRRTISARYGLIATYQESGRWAEAREQYGAELALAREELGPDDRLTLGILEDYAATLVHLGQYEEARPLLEQVLAARERVLGADSPEAAKAMHQLAMTTTELGDFDTTERLITRAMEILEAAYGPDAPWVQYTRNNMGILYWNKGEYERSYALLEPAMQSVRRTHGENHPYTASMMNNLGLVLIELGRYDDAREWTVRALELREKLLPEGHPDIATSRLNYARLLAETGEPQRALALYRSGIEIREASVGADSPTLVPALEAYAHLLRETGDAPGARAQEERARNIRQ